jgi:hypothetical protein
MSTAAVRLIDRVHAPGMRRFLQTGMYIGLVAIVVELALIATQPSLGLRLLWFATIPLAPMIILVAPNLWVSVCPLSTVETLPHRIFGQPRRRLSAITTERLQVAGWALMLAGVPSRHLVFNVDGAATFTAALVILGVALVVGASLLSLNGWCMGACPIRPIEVLYGQFALEKNRPEKCSTCTGCVPGCHRVTPERSHDEFHRSRITRHMAMGFPGFVATYFLLDLLGICNTEHQFFAGTVPAVSNWFGYAALVYGGMAAGFGVSWAVFQLLRPRLRDDARVYRAVALAAFSAYYLGVTPEIREAWKWPLWSVPLMLTLPLAAFVAATWRRPNRALPVLHT